MTHVLLSLIALCGVSGSLAVLLLVAESYFSDYGECEILVNNEKSIKVQGGASLLTTLAEQKLFLPSACGGRGSCGVCKCIVKEGAGPVLPTEMPYLTDQDHKLSVRLSCQVKVKQNIKIQVPEELLSVRDYQTVVEKITPLTHDIRGLRFRLPEGETVKIKAGQYMNLVAPPYGEIGTATARAYSIASAPSDNRAIELIVRLVPNGIVTTYVFQHLKENNTIKLIGPFGDFFLRDSDREIVFIAGGSGLAPIRSIVLDMIEKGIKHRKATFFFGAVRTKDVYYVEEFAKIQAEHPWFSFVPALSGPETDHSYERGLITAVVDRHYPDFKNHEAYLCGSPGMIDACVKVLTAKGMPDSMVFYDKFS
jgi:Na+-transporting NADH:ubiquinone oxidoreductase subunit F